MADVDVDVDERSPTERPQSGDARLTARVERAEVCAQTGSRAKEVGLIPGHSLSRRTAGGGVPTFDMTLDTLTVCDGIKYQAKQSPLNSTTKTNSINQSINLQLNTKLNPVPLNHGLVVAIESSEGRHKVLTTHIAYNNSNRPECTTPEEIDPRRTSRAGIAPLFSQPARRHISIEKCTTIVISHRPQSHSWRQHDTNTRRNALVHRSRIPLH